MAAGAKEGGEEGNSDGRVDGLTTLAGRELSSSSSSYVSDLMASLPMSDAPPSDDVILWATLLRREERSSLRKGAGGGVGIAPDARSELVAMIDSSFEPLSVLRSSAILAGEAPATPISTSPPVRTSLGDEDSAAVGACEGGEGSVGTCVRKSVSSSSPFRRAGHFHSRQGQSRCSLS